MLNKHESTKHFFKELCKNYSILFFILFGSHARNRANELSDIDIAYFPRIRLSLMKENQLFITVCSFYKRDDIDLVDLQKTSLLIRFSSIVYGKILSCSDEKSLYTFMVKTRREYLDTAYMRSIFNHYLQERIQKGRFGK
jgi:predicted nucleotidyltransferase